MVHENREKQNDRKRNSDQPKQCAFAKTHVSLRVLMTVGIIRREGQSSIDETCYSPIDPPSRSIAKSRNNDEDFPAIRSPINCAAMKLKVMPLPPYP